MPPPPVPRLGRKDLPRRLDIHKDLNIIPSPSSSNRPVPPPPGYLRKKLAEADNYANDKKTHAKPTVTTNEADCMVAFRNEEIRLSKQAASTMARREAARGRPRSGGMPGPAALAAAKPSAPPPRQPRPKRDPRNDDRPTGRSQGPHPRPPPRDPGVGGGGYPQQRRRAGAADDDAGRQGAAPGKGQFRADPPRPHPAQPQRRASEAEDGNGAQRGRKRVHFAD